jgi:hypothetical protein
VEPTEEQYLILNALEMELLEHNFYDEEDESWYVRTPSPILLIARLLPNGDITPINFSNNYAGFHGQ